VTGKGQGHSFGFKKRTKILPRNISVMEKISALGPPLLPMIKNGGMGLEVWLKW
jgi:hypothetical protein